MSPPDAPPPGALDGVPAAQLVPLRAAAKRLGRDWRTVRSMILAGQLRGGVRKHGAAHRWFVHSDELPVDTRVAELTDAPRVAQQLAAQVEINRLLLGAQQNLLDAQAQLLAGDAAAMHYRDAALGYQEAAKKYRDALALTLAPDDVSEILDRT